MMFNLKSLLPCIASMLITATLFAGEINGKITIWERTSNEEDWRLAPSNENAVVFITGLEESSTKKKPLHHDQVNKTFSQRVLPLTKGDTVVFRNQDPFNHNVFSLSKAKKFDLGLFKAPVEKSIVFDKPGLVKIFCNIHPQMISNLLVLKNNKYALTKTDGNYRITGIPAGNYKLRVWVEGTKLTSKKITTAPNSQETHNFEIQVLRLPSSHLNKYGKPYKKN